MVQSERNRHHIPQGEVLLNFYVRYQSIQEPLSPTRTVKKYTEKIQESFDKRLHLIRPGVPMSPRQIMGLCGPARASCRIKTMHIFIVMAERKSAGTKQGVLWKWGALFSLCFFPFLQSPQQQQLPGWMFPGTVTPFSLRSFWWQGKPHSVLKLFRVTGVEGSRTANQR